MDLSNRIDQHCLTFKPTAALATSMFMAAVALSLSAAIHFNQTAANGKMDCWYKGNKEDEDGSLPFHSKEPLIPTFKQKHNSGISINRWLYWNIPLEQKKPILQANFIHNLYFTVASES